MPVTRYEIRNEYSLADPELYRAADKDDPEALLEGVAMAGLVGVLRQLGDLAEFAADIFHNLHEDVMATAAKGHVLAVRVQQLENEIPSLERAFLSQTDHSSFFYHPGVDWHQNIRLEKNLVTQGDMPRFIMDSYEECRAPPRLFLLDKFDVGGAGACLKRYTDPSFFKIETSEMTAADIQREKKIRKAKKKGPRWKNRETPEVSPTSHTKLHQLFLEERVENGFNTPRHAKLKRRLNGFPFNSKTGKSYMEEILKYPSPDHEVLHELNGDSPQLKLATNDNKEFGSEILEFRPVSPDRQSGGRKSTHLSPDMEDVALHSHMSDPDEYLIDDPNIAQDGISSVLGNVTGEKVVAVDAESNREGSLTGYGSDDVASEIDDYVDAPSTMESELDRDFDLRMKNDNTSDIKMEPIIVNAYEEPLHSRSSDSQSTGDSTTSDVGNNLSAKEISSFTSDSPDISAEKSQPENFSSKRFQCTDIPVNVTVGASSYQENADEDSLVDHHSTLMISDDTSTGTDPSTNDRSSVPDKIVRNSLLKPPESDEKVSTSDNEEENTYRVVGQSLVVSDGTCTEINPITNQGSEFEQVTSNLCINGSVPTLELSDPEEALEKFEREEEPKSDEMVSTVDDIERINPVIDPPCSPRAALRSQTGDDDLSRSSDGEKSVDEQNGEREPFFSAKHEAFHRTTDSSVKTSSSLLHEDDSSAEDQELSDDAASTSNICNVLSTNDMDAISSGNRTPSQLEDDFLEMPENSLSDYPDAANTGDNFEPKGDNLVDEWDDEDSNVSVDSPNHFSCIMEASPRKEIEETSLVGGCNLYVKDNHTESSIDNQTGAQNLNLSQVANSLNRQPDDCDVHEGDVIPEEDKAVNETFPPEILEPCEVVGLQGKGVSNHVSPKDSETLKRLRCCSEDLEEPARTSDTVEMDGISPYSVSNAKEIEITSHLDMRPENEIHVSLNKSCSDADKSRSTDITSPVPTVSDDACLSMLVEEHNDCFEDSGIDEKNDNSRPLECYREMDIVDKVDSTEAFASDFGDIGCNPVNNGHSESKLSGLVPDYHLGLELDHSPESIHAAKIQSPIEQSGQDREQELLIESNLEKHVHDAPSLPVNDDAEKSVHLNQNLLYPMEISSDLSSLPPMNYLQILDGDCSKGESNSVSASSLANPLGSILPTSNPFLEADQINLADLPPLPPLPPVQWRMGKLQHVLPSAEEETIRNEESFSQLSFLTAPTDDVDSTLSTKPTQDGASPATASTGDIISLREETKDSLTEVTIETKSKEENPVYICSSSDTKTLHEITDHPLKIENKPQLLDVPVQESVSTPSAAEDGAENGSQKVKLRWPRNPPLIDDVSFLDKSKLRKVTERTRPELPKVDERDSLLEQIRAKSFNLRPAMASRPSIRSRGPDTNLRVVAILEKANAIRQALAGSDEDDDDSWSE